MISMLMHSKEIPITRKVIPMISEPIRIKCKETPIKSKEIPIKCKDIHRDTSGKIKCNADKYES